MALVVIAGEYFEGRELNSMLSVIASILYIFYIISGAWFLFASLYSFYLAYKYAEGDRITWFFGLLFFGLIVVPVVMYRFGKGIEPYNE